MLKILYRDDCGFVVSTELVFVVTLLVIGLIVGLSEVQHAVVQELNDVADAIGELNQSYSFTGFSADKSGAPAGVSKSSTEGSAFADTTDDCDRNQCDLACGHNSTPTPEGPK